MESYELKKALWTEADFEQMGWHDSIIYGLSLIGDFEKRESELMLDIDYIFQWNQPTPPNKHFTFWVAPCTMVFNNVLNVQFNIDTGLLIGPDMEIDSLNLLEYVDKGADSPKAIKWHMELQRGDIFFEADSFKQYVRQLPSHCQGQQLLLEKRGGISFEKKQAAQ